MQNRRGQNIILQEDRCLSASLPPSKYCMQSTLHTINYYDPIPMEIHIRRQFSGLRVCFSFSLNAPEGTNQIYSLRLQAACVCVCYVLRVGGFHG